MAAVAAGAEPERAELTEFLVEHGIFASVAAGLVEWLLAHKTVAESKVYALAHLRAVQDGENPRGQRLQGEQAIGRWVARLREHARAPEWALDQAARELEAGDDEDEEVFDEDDLEADDEFDDELPGEDMADLAAGSDAGADEEIVCVPLNGELATPSAVWEAAKAQLRFQMVRGAYDNWIADTRCAGVEDGPEETDTGMTLVVQAADRYAVEWLELRLKRLVLRTLQGLVGGPIGIRFQTDGQNPAP